MYIQRAHQTDSVAINVRYRTVVFHGFIQVSIFRCFSFGTTRIILRCEKRQNTFPDLKPMHISGGNFLQTTKKTKQNRTLKRKK